MSRLAMVIYSIWSVLVLLKNTTIGLRRPPMLSITVPAKSRSWKSSLRGAGERLERSNWSVTGSRRHWKRQRRGLPSVHRLHEVFVRKAKMPEKPKAELGNSRSYVVKVAVL